MHEHHHKSSHHTEQAIKVAGKVISGLIDLERSESSPSQQQSNANPMANQGVAPRAINSSISSYEPSLKSLEQQISSQIGYSPTAIINEGINLRQNIENAAANEVALVFGGQPPANNQYSFPTTATTPGPIPWPDAEEIKYMGEGLKLGMKAMSHIHLPATNSSGRPGGFRSRLASMGIGKGGEKGRNPSTDTNESQNEVW
jgi:hypothetical protein